MTLYGGVNKSKFTPRMPAHSPETLQSILRVPAMMMTERAFANPLNNGALAISYYVLREIDCVRIDEFRGRFELPSASEPRKWRIYKRSMSCPSIRLHCKECTQRERERERN